METSDVTNRKANQLFRDALGESSADLFDRYSGIGVCRITFIRDDDLELIEAIARHEQRLEDRRRYKEEVRLSRTVFGIGQYGYRGRF